jgi:hypothetical protein
MYPPLVHSAATFCGTPSDLYPASRTYIPKVCKPQIVGASARLAYRDPSAASILLGRWESDEAVMAAQGLGHSWGLTRLAGVAGFRDGSVARGETSPLPISISLALRLDPTRKAAVVLPRPRDPLDSLQVALQACNAHPAGRPDLIYHSSRVRCFEGHNGFRPRQGVKVPCHNFLHAVTPER